MVVTVTAEESVVFQTVTTVVTEYNTVVETAVFPVTETATANPETQLFTVSSTTTDFTQTDRTTTTQTVVVTETAHQTVTATVTSAFSSQAPLKARVEDNSGSTGTMPDYASAVCPSWQKYVAACRCVGVTPTTVTVGGEEPAVTVTMPATSTVTVPVSSTLSSIETEVITVTPTVSATQVDMVPVTEITTVIQTDVVTSTITTTETQTVTQTVVPQPTCKSPSSVGVFSASATEVSPAGQHLMAAPISGGGIRVSFKAYDPSTEYMVTNRFNWKIDSNGYLEMPYSIIASGLPVSPHINLPVATVGRAQVLMTLSSNVDFGVSYGVAARIKACVNPVTGELALEAAGLTKLLQCNGLLYLAPASSPLPSGCVAMHPKVGSPISAPVAT